MSRSERVRVWNIVALPFAFFCIPLIAGYSWSALGPKTPTVPQVPGSESYLGRRPSLPITMEYYGAGVVVVPFRAHVRAALERGELPLWNPYAGIGQPLAAQGEGGPYSPFAILRALAPPTWANAVTFGVFLMSALALVGFLRLLGLSPMAAALGGGAWALSGALTLHIPRDNLADQLAMIPVLLLAAAWAVRSERPIAYAAFALATALHGLAGYLQIGINALILLVGFLIVACVLHASTARARLVAFGKALLTLVCGLALTSPYTFPIVEALLVAHNKNFPFLAFIPMPSANIIAMFFPLLWGQPLHGWLAGDYPTVADWNNLFSYGSTGLLLLALFGATALRGQRRDQQAYFLYFTAGMLFFLARYISFPPVAGINFLPILSQQSPKHTNGVIVFCLVVAAAFGAEWLRRTDGRRVAWLTLSLLLMVTSSVLTLMGRHGATLSVELETAALYVTVTIAIVTIVLFGLRRAQLARSDSDAAFIAAAVVVGELSMYLPIGNGDPAVVGLRIVIFGLIVLASLLATGGAIRLAGAAGVGALVLYAGIIVVPSTGLPSQREGEPAPAYVSWLQDAAAGHRVFGIQPDYAGISGIQDIEAVGPLATREYMSFVDLVSSRAVYEAAYYGSTFSLVHPHREAPLYDLTRDYARAKPLLDWFGVKYLVLENRVFGTEGAVVLPHLLTTNLKMDVAYRDGYVTIVESTGAGEKAVFAMQARRAESASEAIELLRVDPTLIGQAVLVEAPDDSLRKIRPTGDDAAQLPVELAAYESNYIRARFDAPRAGIFVLKDSFFPGWQATLDGQAVPVVRVNGMVRGVIVPGPGRHEITMDYSPWSFTLGMVVSGAALAMLAAFVIWATLIVRLREGGRRDLRRPRSRPTLAGVMPHPRTPPSA